MRLLTAATTLRITAGDDPSPKGTFGPLLQSPGGAGAHAATSPGRQTLVAGAAAAHARGTGLAQHGGGRGGPATERQRTRGAHPPAPPAGALAPGPHLRQARGGAGAGAGGPRGVSAARRRPGARGLRPPARAGGAGGGAGPAAGRGAGARRSPPARGGAGRQRSRGLRGPERAGVLDRAGRSAPHRPGPGGRHLPPGGARAGLGRRRGHRPAGDQCSRARRGLLGPGGAPGGHLVVLPRHRPPGGGGGRRLLAGPVVVPAVGPHRSPVDLPGLTGQWLRTRSGRVGPGRTRRPAARPCRPPPPAGYGHGQQETRRCRVTTAAQDWLSARVSSTRDIGLRGVLQELVEHLSLATSEAVTLRRLSADRQRLVPVAWFHPDPSARGAIGEIMSHTAELSDAGLWRPVVEERRPARWHLPPGSAPALASEEQARWLQRYPLRAVMGAPVVGGEDLLGGVALLRFGRDAPFTDDDEGMLVYFAERVADVLVLLDVP
nr:GAF domain-containing protein [Quadrisphaera sp. RL12-1S]